MWRYRGRGGRHRFDGVRHPNFDFHTACTVRVGAAAIRRTKIFRVHDDTAGCGAVRGPAVLDAEARPPVRRDAIDAAPVTMRLISTRPRMALYKDASASLDDLREAVTTLEDTERIARRVFGGAHPITKAVEVRLRESRAALSARETPSPPPASA